VIAHRLSALTYADKIVFIEGGRLAEAGSHDELLLRQGGYWKMWKTQVNNEPDRDSFKQILA
jgi:subfamily B ATP-binding cassette protein MsbA